ncbi:MAG: CHASE4 domain-containing protein [Chloroflexales bacterium]
MGTISLRTRTLLIVLMMLGVLVSILLLLADSIIERGFRSVEDHTAQEHVQQVANALSDSIASLDRTTRDYAVWDDTYAYVSKPGPAYAADNIADVTFTNNNLSFMAFVNAADELVYARAFDLATQQEVPVPADLRRFTGRNARLLQHADPAGHLAGLAVLADGPMLLAARPILTSQGKGPAAGTLIMGLRLDTYEIARLAAITRLPISMIYLDDPALAAISQQAATEIAAGSPSVTIPLDSQHTIGNAQVADLLGGPGMLLQVELPRDIYELGQQATREYTLALLIAGGVFGLLMFWMLDRTVLVRIISLRTQVAAVDARQPVAQITITGGDEISLLGDAINLMLGELVQSQYQLAENERRYRHLIEFSPDAIIVHDGQHIRYTNLAGARLLGNGAPETYVGLQVNAPIRALVPASDGSPVLAERELTHPDGSTIAVELIVLAFCDRDEPSIQVIVRNITERKQVELALRTAKDAADAANRAKSMFLATMSHELRTPLTAIIGYTELLGLALADPASGDVFQDLGRIRSASTHLLAIINAILNISQIEAGRMQVQSAPVTVAVVLAMVADTVQVMAKDNGNRLTIHGANAAGEIETDEVHLRQILINLLGNACKFTHAGQIALAVRVLPGASGADTDQITFAVRDTGIGMRPDQLDLLFRDFVQIDASTTRKYAGTGLGLALSQRLAHLIGGRITVTSALGEGSTFTLTLPRRPAAGISLAQASPAAAPAIPPVTSVAPRLTDVTQETQIVLVIDDDPSMHALLLRTLAHPRLHVEAAATGVAGLDLAAVLLPDMIILDTLLPDMDGWAVLRRLKDVPETRAIPVLLLAIRKDAARAMALGAAGVLYKPLDVDHLAPEIATVLGDNVLWSAWTLTGSPAPLPKIERSATNGADSRG